MKLDEVRKSIVDLRKGGWDDDTLDAFKERFLRDHLFMDAAVKELLRPGQGDKFVDEWIIQHHDVRFNRGKITGKIKLNVKNKKELEVLKREGKWILVSSWNIDNDMLLEAVWGFELDHSSLIVLNRAFKNKKKSMEVLFNQYEILFKQRKVILFYRNQLLEENYNKRIWDWLNSLRV